jgi:hypothetical protein
MRTGRRSAGLSGVRIESASGGGSSDGALTTTAPTASRFHFVLRGLISLLKRWGGELGDIAGLVGLDYRAVVVLYVVIVVSALYYCARVADVRVNLFAAGSFVALFAGYVFVMVAVESVDREWRRSRRPS